MNDKAKRIIKYAIYYLIKGTEQAFEEGRYDKKKNWIYDLARRISSYGFNSINENLTVITFNYDRTFDKYFVESLKENLPLNSNQISQLRENVIHVYNSLGNLKEVAFELENTKVDVLKKHYDRINLVDDRGQICFKFPDADEYKNVHFLGFGYDKTNIKLLNLEQFSSAYFHGTTYGYEGKQISALKKDYKIDAKPISCWEYVEKELFKHTV